MDYDYLSTLRADHISSLSDTQEKILFFATIIPSLLSCLGSSQIIYLVLWGGGGGSGSQRPKTNPYRRILLGLSCSDLIASITYPLQNILLPQDTSQRVWAVGNDASCTFLGLAQQLSFSSVFYNGMLSLYFLISVRWGVQDRVFAKRYEPYMHLLSIAFPVITGLVGVGMGFYHEIQVGTGCWVSRWPDGCGCNEGETGECCKSQLIAWIIGGFPTIFNFLMILINNLLVFCHVYRTIQRGRRKASTKAIVSASVRSQRNNMMAASLRQSSTDNNNHPSTMMTASSSMRQSENPNNSAVDVEELLRQSQQQSSRRQQQKRQDPQLARIRAVATQASLYVVAFLIAYIPAITLRIMESMSYDAEDEDTLFPLLVIQALTWPLQGFLNLLIYVRPTYLRIRRDFSAESRWWAFRRALYGDQVKPRMPQSNNDNNNSRARRTRRTTDFGIGCSSINVAPSQSKFSILRRSLSRLSERFSEERRQSNSVASFGHDASGLGGNTTTVTMNTYIDPVVPARRSSISGLGSIVEDHTSPNDDGVKESGKDRLVSDDPTTPVDQEGIDSNNTAGQPDDSLRHDEIRRSESPADSGSSLAHDDILDAISTSIRSQTLQDDNVRGNEVTETSTGTNAHPVESHNVSNDDMSSSSSHRRTSLIEESADGDAVCSSAGPAALQQQLLLSSTDATYKEGKEVLAGQPSMMELSHDSEGTEKSQHGGERFADEEEMEHGES